MDSERHAVYFHLNTLTRSVIYDMSFSATNQLRNTCQFPLQPVTTQMAKKRDRRVAPSSNRGKDRVESSDQSSDPKLTITLVLSFCVAAAAAVLAYRIKYAHPITNRAQSYVHQRGLVKIDVNYQEILTASTTLVTSLFCSAFGLFGCRENVGN